MAISRNINLSLILKNVFTTTNLNIKQQRCIRSKRGYSTDINGDTYRTIVIVC